MSGEVVLSERERQSLLDAGWDRFYEPGLLPAVEAILAARLAAADRDAGLRELDDLLDGWLEDALTTDEDPARHVHRAVRQWIRAALEHTDGAS